jgi:hypothetical protein
MVTGMINIRGDPAIHWIEKYCVTRDGPDGERRPVRLSDAERIEVWKLYNNGPMPDAPISVGVAAVAQFLSPHPDSINGCNFSGGLNIGPARSHIVARLKCARRIVASHRHWEDMFFRTEWDLLSAGRPSQYRGSGKVASFPLPKPTGIDTCIQRAGPWWNSLIR